MTHKFVRYYTCIVLLLFNIFLVFVAVNMLLWVVLIIHPNALQPSYRVTDAVQIKKLETVYPEYTLSQIEELERETWTRGFMYDPFVHLRERPYSGTYVNVSPYGYRKSFHQGPFPLDRSAYNIFFFGGSTAFGYGVSDTETIASYLEAALQKEFPHKTVYVYNFGQGGFYSSQELIFFERLLVTGSKPDLAIFFDGLNEFAEPNDVPNYTDTLQQFVDETLQGNRATGHIGFMTFVSKLPITRFAYEWRSQLDRLFAPIYNMTKLVTVGQSGHDAVKYRNKQLLTSVIDRYETNTGIIRDIASANSVTAVFVIQPVPTYQYDLHYHLFYAGNFFEHTYSQYGYPLLQSYIRLYAPPGFFSLAGMQQNIHKPLYVDLVHYTAAMNKTIANTLLDELIRQGYLNNPKFN